MSNTPVQQVEVKLEALGIIALEQSFALAELALALFAESTIIAIESLLNQIANLAGRGLTVLKRWFGDQKSHSTAHRESAEFELSGSNGASYF